MNTPRTPKTKDRHSNKPRSRRSPKDSGRITPTAPLVVREHARPRARMPPWKGYVAAIVAVVGTSTTAGSPTTHVRLAALAFAAIVAVVLALRPR